MVRKRRAAAAAVGIVAGASLIAAPVAYADIVHPDDVIIQFSLCVGNDCVNGESFGFDTVRLKENNLRMHFDDTSTTASFPRRDWRIVINDSSNGGDEYFRIEDSTGGRNVFQIDAGAPNNALRLDSGGDLGIGTSNPVVDLHVASGNTPTLRLEQNGTSGFTPQTWDVAGNEAGFFVRDATNGSTLPFRILPGAASQALVIDGEDQVGINSGTTPDKDLHITGNDNPTVRIEQPDVAGAGNKIWDFEFQFNGDLALKDGSGNQKFRIFGNDARFRIGKQATLPAAGVQNGDLFVKDNGGADQLCFRTGGVWVDVITGANC